MFTAKQGLSDSIESLNVFPYMVALEELDSEMVYYTIRAMTCVSFDRIISNHLKSIQNTVIDIFSS